MQRDPRDRRLRRGTTVGRAATVVLLLVVSLVGGGPAAVLHAQVAETEHPGAAAIGLSLRQLGTTKRVLMIAAHPDDEATQVLSALALGQGADVAYLSLTRGEGGQNGIGAEMHEGLGLLRTEELLAARRLDGAHQYFTRAIDWGFSKNADEAFSHWPREELLRDAVAVVRHFRPDVIVSVFSGTPRDGHGQHQAAGIIAAEAFEAAADPGRFPDQMVDGLRPHGPAHLYQLVRGPAAGPATEIATGQFDPLLGRSHFQVAMASRSRHRSQDMGRELTPGPQSTLLTRTATRVEGADPASLFAGVDTTLSAHLRRLAGGSAPSAGGVGTGGGDAATSAVATGPHAAAATLSPDEVARLQGLITRYQATLDDMRSAFNPLLPDRSLYFVVEAARALDDAVTLVAGRPGAAEEFAFHLSVQRARIGEALLRSARVTLDAIGEDETIVPGQRFELELRLWNGGTLPVDLERLEPDLPEGWTASARDPLVERLEPGAVFTRRFEVAVPAHAPVTEPYFLRSERQGARYVWPAEAGHIGIPFELDEVGAIAALRIRAAPVLATVSATYRGVDRRSGEFRRPIRVVPPVALSVGPQLAIVPLARAAEPIRVSVALRAEQPGGIGGILRPALPDGWRSEPAELAIRFEGAGEERVVEFVAHPPPDLGPGRTELDFTFLDERGSSFDRGFTLIDYPHVRPRPLYRPARVAVEAIDVAVPANLRVGYVAATGDNVPHAIGQLGVDLRLLSAADLAAAPLEPFDVIVVGPRAYEGRPDLVTHNQRLLDYVRRGGTMVVQYNQYEYTADGIAPFPLAMARPHDRVTDHEAEVRMLAPDHPVLSWPNRIAPADFDGWVQERGLYFLNSWDSRYTPLLEMADPGEAPNRGSLMIAPVGEGLYVYMGLALFRQLPAGVPGAYRLLANLLALGSEP